VQGLLDSIIKGACVLNGQVEPFIWLIGRMADWQRKVLALRPGDPGEGVLGGPGEGAGG
jgi:hypothetical protein